MKTGKSILGLILVLLVLITGVGVCADDIIDFIPAIIKPAKFGNAMPNPFFILPGVSTPVTITVYIPDADLVPDSVQLKEGTSVVGTLTDTGNKVFSITNNFQRDSGGAIKLNIAAAFGNITKTIARFEIKILNVPTIQDSAQYNQAVDNIFSTLVASRDNFRALTDSTTPGPQLSSHIINATEKLLSVYAGFEAIYRTETHSPSNFPAWIDYIPTYSKLIKNIHGSLDSIVLFKQNPNDPRVADILAYAQEQGLDINSPTDREFAAQYYISHGPKFQTTLQEANTIAIKELSGQYTSIAGDGVSEWISNKFMDLKGILIGEAVGEGFNYLLDIFVSAVTSTKGLIVAKVNQNEALQVPAGSHNTLYSFTDNQERAIVNNITVNPNSTVTVSVAPGSIQYANLKDGLVAYYPLDENANDKSGNNLNGTVYGAVLAPDRFNNSRSAYYFTNLIDYIELPPDNNLFQSNNFSVSIWVKIPQVTTIFNQMGIIGNITNYTLTYWLLGILDNDYPPDLSGKIQFGLRTAEPASERGLISTFRLDDNIWHHIVIVRDAAASRMYLYIDGALNGSSQASGSPVWSGQHVTIARHLPILQRHLIFTADDVRLYNRAILASEVQELYLSPSFIP